MSERKTKSLMAMLNAFPQSNGNADLTLRTYMAVLDDVSDDAVRDTARRFISGLVPRQHKTFAPSIAEFCVAARGFDKIAEIKSRPRLAPPVYPKRGSYFERQIAAREKYLDYRVLAENITSTEYQTLSGRGALENPHFYVASLGTVYYGSAPSKRLARLPSVKPAWQDAEA